MSLKLAAFVDGSVYSASVCDHAAWLANLNAPSRIMVTHMLGRRSRQSVPADLSGNLSLGARTDLLTKLSAADEEWAQLALARGRAILEDVAARLAEKTEAAVETRLRHDDLADAVAEQDADVIVVGKRGEASGYAREHLGSNLERVLRGSDKPVLVANYEFSPIERCLIAYDGGTSIAKAVRYLSGTDASAYAGIEFHILKAGEDTLMRARRAGRRRRHAETGRADRDLGNPCGRTGTGHSRRGGRKEKPDADHGRLRP